MTRRILALAAVLAVSVSGVALAAKPKVKKVKTRGTISANVIPGSPPLAAGVFNDRKLQGGAIVFSVQGTNGGSGTVHITSKHIALYTIKGSLRGTAKVDLSPGPNGTSIFKNGTFKVAKGTGAYKGWSMKGTFAGTLGDSGYSFKYKGTISKPKK